MRTPTAFPYRRGAAALVAALALALLPIGPGGPSPAGADDTQFGVRPDEPPARRVVFPIAGADYSNDWHNPRSGGRLHLGNDLFAPKHTPVVSTVDGRVEWMKVEDSGNGGRMIAIEDRQGWSYRYMHLNNDNPGTDDNVAPPELTVAPGMKPGALVRAGQVIGWVGDSGNAEGSSPHIHFEVMAPDGQQVNPFPSLQLSQGKSFGNLCNFGTNPYSRPSDQGGRGYYVIDREGGVFSFGAVPFHGSVPSLRAEGREVGAAEAIDIATTPTADGYWVLDEVGGIFAFGASAFHGSIPQLRAEGRDIGPADVVDLEVRPGGDGYWVLDSEGGIFAFGAAAFHGSIPQLRAEGRDIGPADVIDLEPTADGDGYWVLDSEGGIFAFGSARFEGSIPQLREQGREIGRADVTGIAATPDGRGYWVIDERGGVFSFGSAGYFGSVPGAGVCWADRVDGIEPTGTGQGYWMVGADGRVWAFGDARYHGALDTLAVPQAGAAALSAATEPAGE